MINLRYHIVSITAVFLALGIGLMLGGTYLDKYTVDQLDKNISDAERRISETRAENRRLEDLVGDSKARELSMLAEGSERLLAGQLTDRPVVVVIGPGVDAAAADGVRYVLDASDADLRATVVMHDEMMFGGDVDQGLAEAIGLDSPRSVELARAVYAQLHDAFLAAGQPVRQTPDQPPTTPSTTTPDGTPTTVTPTSLPASTAPGTTPEDPDADATTSTTVPDTADGADDGALDGTQPSIITELAARGLITIEAGPGHAATDPILETEGYTYVFVSGVGPSTDQSTVPARLLSTTPGDVLPVVVVSPSYTSDQLEDAPAPTLVAHVRGDERLRAVYSTVDDADTFSGLVAAVFVLVDLPNGTAGHYGQGPGAQAVLPSAP